MRAPLHTLTPREREVLALLRRGLTNEEIASRLDISLDGAKYHVSQILSKLGVATREEAAALAVGERRRWWAAWPLWARIAGAATLAAVTAGIAVLAWGVLLTKDQVEEDAVSDLTLEDLSSRVQQAMTRRDFVLHSSLDFRQQDENGVISGESRGSFEFWIDASNERMRFEFNIDPSQPSDGSEGATGLIADNVYYSVSASGDIEKSEVVRNCPATDKLLVALFLLCPNEPANGASRIARVEGSSEYGGKSAVVLVVEESYVTTLSGGPLPAPTLGTVPPTEPATSVETRNTSRTYVAVDNFLPIARTHEIREDGEFHDASVLVYRQHEFVPMEQVAGLFDPASLSPTP
jgi:DNA-binding CsgD family transcriptional regulator